MGTCARCYKNTLKEGRDVRSLRLIELTKMLVNCVVVFVDNFVSIRCAFSEASEEFANVGRRKRLCVVHFPQNLLFVNFEPLLVRDVFAACPFQLRQPFPDPF